jgi:ketosteroid isomerase-like protein
MSPAAEEAPMRRIPVLDEDRASITAWFARWGVLVGNVDFARVREMFVEDAIAFGSKVEMVTSRRDLEHDQWRAVGRPSRTTATTWRPWRSWCRPTG